jgi:hypothetical protein
MRKRKRRARNNGSMYEGKWTGILRKTVQGYDFQGSSYTRCEIAGIWLDAYSGVQGRDNVPQQLVQYVREHEIPSFVYDHLEVCVGYG